MANLYRASGDLDAALSWGFRAITAADEAKLRDLEIESRNTVGHMLLIKDTRTRWPAGNAKGVAGQETTGSDLGPLGPYRPTRPTEFCGQALALFDQAIKLLDVARRTFDSESDRIALIERPTDTYGGAVLACMAMGDTYQKIKYMKKRSLSRNL